MSNEEMMIDSQAGVLAYLQSGIHIDGQQVRRISGGGLEMAVAIKGSIKGYTSESEAQVEGFGNALFAPGALPWAEVTRLGQGWQTMQVAATAALQHAGIQETRHVPHHGRAGDQHALARVVADIVLHIQVEAEGGANERCPGGDRELRQGVQRWSYQRCRHDRCR